VAGRQPGHKDERSELKQEHAALRVPVVRHRGGLALVLHDVLAASSANGFHWLGMYQ
jgi:hypothetical protein